MLIIQDKRIDSTAAETESVAADFAMHRRRSRALGLGNLVSLVAEAMIPSLTTAPAVIARFGARCDLRGRAAAPLVVKRNPSYFASMRNEEAAIGVSREFLGAYQRLQEQTGVGSYARIDSLEAGWEYRVEVADYDVTVPALPREADGMCVVQLSDLHVGRLVRSGDVRRIAEFVSTLQPNAIVLTGDLVFQPSSPEELGRALGYIRALSPSAGVYATLGNHDHWDGAAQVRAALQANGIALLHNENCEITPGVRLAGIDDLLAGQPDLPAALRGIPPDAFVILLSHNPNILPQATSRNLLILSGHTHGAQLKFAWQDFASTTHPDLYAHLATVFETVGYVKRGGNVDGLGCWRYMEGWYAAGKALMYVSRGIGMVRPPYRINCPAEIVAFHLR